MITIYVLICHSTLAIIHDMDVDLWVAAYTTVIQVLSSASNRDCIIQANKCFQIIHERAKENPFQLSVTSYDPIIFRAASKWMLAFVGEVSFILYNIFNKNPIITF